MKRKMITGVLTVSMIAACAAGIGGCGSENSGAETAAVQQTEVSEKAETAASYTVTYYDSDGTTVLSTEEVEEGALLEEKPGEKDGYTFVGWFATPQMNHRFDFTKPVTGDTSLFGGFVSYQEDTREFAIVGSGKSPVLLESNWGKVIGDAQKMTKEEKEDANIYTITLDLEAGDQFQFAINESWENQRGYGYLTSIEQDGTEYFKNAGGLGDTGVKRANIEVAVAGNYTFTLTTYPAEDTYDTGASNYAEENKECFNLNPYDTITWTYNGEAENSGVEAQTDYYIKGAKITDWQDDYADTYKFAEEDGIYKLTVDLEEGDEFMFTSLVTVGETQSTGNEYIRYTNIAESDTESLSFVTGTENANLVAGATGSYTFTYDPATQVLTVSMK